MEILATVALELFEHGSIPECSHLVSRSLESFNGCPAYVANCGHVKVIYTPDWPLMNPPPVVFAELRNCCRRAFYFTFARSFLFVCMLNMLYCRRLNVIAYNFVQ